ncbi:hypothetical protein KXQ82_05385 [Mucilaginibacter sp. HMF5004]|uniref:hypothetical protein n=1 Tax=Mucilaginibacter rivuli TaxID=2857527 RepID=UPI001C5EF6A8|nr:hypothetical protein [Mucilaginibacter rivuli]MBW4889135.1 hypothetical protein [Mucilaginibacter rivuli]
MKKHIMYTAFAVALFLTACRGNHAANAGRDTAEMHLPQTKSVDTTKATQTDHSGNGGSQTVLDSDKK